MEPEGSLPHSQVPATFPYPEPDLSTLDINNNNNNNNYYCNKPKLKISTLIDGKEVTLL